MFGEGDEMGRALRRRQRSSSLAAFGRWVYDELPAREGKKAHTPLSAFNPLGYSHSGVVRRAFLLYFMI